MAKRPTAQKQDETPKADRDESEFDRFESLVRKLVRVPKAELDKLRKREM